MNSQEFKRVLKIAHDNTHSISRILGNVKLIREGKFEGKSLNERLSIIEKSCLECRQQVDELYTIIKECMINEYDTRRNT